MQPTTGAAGSWSAPPSRMRAVARSRSEGPGALPPGAGPLHVLRDWTLPQPWVASQDLGILGKSPGFFEDSLGVLAEPGGAVSVAVHDGPLPESIAAVAQRRARHRPPPTVLIERRALRCPPPVALRRWREAAGESEASGRPASGLSSPREVRMATAGVYQVALVRTRPWLAAGPGVRVSAVLIMDGVRDALVLTMTWDDEDGMEALDALAIRTVQQLGLQIDPPPEMAAELLAHAPGRQAGRIPRQWNGVSTPARAGAPALRAVTQGLSAGVRGVFGDRFVIPCLLVWVLGVTVLVAQVLAAGTAVASVVATSVLIAACVLPYLLAWRAWTILHGLVTDPVDRTMRLPAQRMRPTGLWYYLATAAILGAALFVSMVGGLMGALPIRQGAALVAWTAGHVLLVALEHLRPGTPRLRRWWQQRASARLGAATLRE
ncbi:hypothetical protein [Bogoriella caseilytica]|uniref:Uncharacterized protein n=1 Tax=Bogoriella caseilytica TaxID=56055 RepID=A0A3N2BFV1_9MICO|nr:hypothetical protein [Bogoriella caseilytica]ROR74098.1 hypothetical protein EDD31_2495 [Bogoriella caseilytica]